MKDLTSTLALAATARSSRARSVGARREASAAEGKAASLSSRLLAPPPGATAKLVRFAACARARVRRVDLAARPAAQQRVDDACR